jgi:hypothetical protein
VRVVAGNLIEAGSEERLLWNKLDAVRHDPALVARELVGIVEAHRARVAELATERASGAGAPVPQLKPLTP